MRLDRLAALPYRAPKSGRDYWVLDGALREPAQVRARLDARTDWVLGAPHRPEHWPGRRAPDALTRDELAPIERWVRQQTGAKALWQPEVAAGARLDHNVVQQVGAGEARPAPHTDSRKLCTYAAVLYLSPDADPGGGTSFFRLKLPGGKPGGNTVEAPYANLVEALGVSALPAELFARDAEVENRFNRLLVYRANLVHAATRYFGAGNAARTTIVLFWLAR